MNTNKKIKVGLLVAAIGVTSSWASAGDTALFESYTSSNAVAFDPQDFAALDAEVDLIVKGPNNFYVRKSFAAGIPVELIPATLADGGLPDGTYRYELQIMGIHGVSRDRDSEQPATSTTYEGLSGAFSVLNGEIVTADSKEAPSLEASSKSMTGTGLPALEEDIITADDAIIQFSLCVGNDCVNGENFGFDTVRLKENNLRIKFDDTSNSASFPSNDWQITANDTTNGGANKFSIDDITGGRTPFTIEASAPSHSLYVDDGGRVGLGTSTPVVEAHVVDGDSPTLRLQQDGSSGFTPQTWDVVGNEASFFVRDVSNGSTLPFRIRPSAPSSSIDIAANGDVGVGTSSPGGALHVRRSGNVIPLIESSDNNAVQLRFKTNSTNRRFLAVDSANQVESQVEFGDGIIKFLGATATDNLMEVDATSLRVSGNIVSNGQQLNVPDYVFQADYDLMTIAELKSFIEKNSHLPNVPSAREVNESGLNHTQFQLQLLEKIEELTLYTIQQQEMIELQGKAIEKLEKRLNELN